MRHIYVFVTSLLLFGNVLTAQVNESSNNNQQVSLDPVTPSREQVEGYISNHYSFPSILDSLGVIYDYNFNIPLTNFVREHIQSFYNLIYTGVENHSIISKDEVALMYVNFLDSTRLRLHTTNFPKDPPNSSNPPEKLLNGPCVNMDFEDGSTTGWDLFDGQVDGSVQYSYTNNVAVGPGASHLIVNGGNDPVCGFPMVNPGGSYSMRLGDGTVTNYGAARARQTFLVTAANSIFTYSYALVLQSPVGHSATEQPYFAVRVYDQNNNNVTCGSYSVVAASGNQADFMIINVGGEDVWYKNWTTVFAPLQSYIGQNVTIEFTTGDCGQGGHYGYAYVDASCGTSAIIPSATSICNGTPVTLTAPLGAASYLWSTGATTQQITVTTGGVYSVTMTPVSGSACNITLDITILSSSNPTAIFSGAPTTICAGQTITFTDASTIPSPDNILNWQWDFGDGISSPMANGTMTGVTGTTGSYTNPTHTYTTAGNYNVTLTVETIAGCQSTITHPVTVTNGPTVNAGPDITVCDGTSVTLTASGTAATYNWNNGVTNGTPFTQPVGSINYILTGANGSCSSKDTMNVTVISNPTPSISPASYCQGSSTTIDAGPGYNSYLWSNGATTQTATFTAANNPISVTVTMNPSCTGTSQAINVTEVPVIIYDSTVTICAGQSAAIFGVNHTTAGIFTQLNTSVGGCDSTTNITLVVNPLPIVNAGIDQTVCSGVPITLTATGATIYNWDNGVPNGIPFTQTVGTTTYTVTGTDANGCVNTDATDITVNSTPIVNAGIDQAVCDGVQTTLTASGADSYNWNNGVTNGVAFAQAIGTTTYTVTGTTLGCITNDQVNITVYALPIVAAGNDFSICDGATAVLTGSGATTYTWDNSVINGVSFTPTATATYTVVGTDIHGCIGTDNLILTIIPIPTVDFSGDNLKGCSPLTVNFTNSSIGNLTNCQWSFSNGSNITNCGSVNQTFTAIGCYDVTLTVSTPEGCTNTRTFNNYVCVVPNPIADFYFNPKELSTVDWQANMTNTSIDATSYIWNFGDGVSSSSTDFEPSHEFPNDGPGTYNIMLIAINADGCRDTTSKPIVVKEDLIFYVPNTFTPDHDDFNEVFKPIFTSGYDPYDYTLLIFNRWGEVLFESHDTDFGWDGTYGGKITEDGTYIWQITVKIKGIDKREIYSGHLNILR